MPYYKFHLLHKFFQIQATYKTDVDKIQILNVITDKFATVFVPGQSIVIDEGIAPFRGRFKYIIYMPMKPDKWG